MKKKPLNLIDVAKCATLLGISQPLLYKMVAQNKIPHYRINSKIIFEKANMETWFANRRNKK